MKAIETPRQIKLNPRRRLKRDGKPETPPSKEPKESPSKPISVSKLLTKRRPARHTEFTQEVLEDRCDALLDKIHDAINIDGICLDRGEPGLARLRLIPTLEKELSNKLLSQIFVNRRGLDIFLGWIEKFPDGTWPAKTMILDVLRLIDIIDVDPITVRGSALESTLLELRFAFKGEEIDRCVTKILNKWNREKVEEEPEILERHVRKILAADGDKSFVRQADPANRVPVTTRRSLMDFTIAPKPKFEPLPDVPKISSKNAMMIKPVPGQVISRKLMMPDKLAGAPYNTLEYDGNID